MHLLTALESVADISEALSRCAEPVNTLNDILTTLTLPIDRYFHRQYLEAAQNANRAVTLLEQALPLLLPDDMATVRALIAKYRDVAQTIESQLGEPVIGVHNVATKGNAKHSPEGAKRSSAVQTLGAVIPDSTPRKYRLICDILQAAGDHDVTREKVKRLLNR